MSKTNLKKTLIMSYILCMMTSIITTVLCAYVYNQKPTAQLMELIIFIFGIIPIIIYELFIYEFTL